MATLRDLAPGYNPNAALADNSSLRFEDIPVAPPAAPQEWQNQTERAGMSELAKGYTSGRISDQANWLANEESARRMAGDKTGADAVRQRISSLQEQAAYWAPKEQDVTKLNWEPGRILDWAGGATGQLAASMQDSLLSGAALRGGAALAGMSKNPIAQAISRGGNALSAAGSFIPNYLSNAGETYNELAQDKTLTDTQRSLGAAGAGLAMGALDTLPDMGILHRVAGGPLAKLGPKSILGRTALDSGMEGVTEVAQTGVQKGVHSYLNPNRDTSGDADEYWNALASAAVGGAPMHGASAAIQTMRERLGDPGEPGSKKGDAYDIKTGEKISDEGNLKSFEDQLKEAGLSGYGSIDAAKERASVLDGRKIFDAVNNGDTDGATKATEETRAALLEELNKLGDDKSKQLMEEIGSAPAEDLMLSDAIERASEHVLPKIALDQENLDRVSQAFGKKRNQRNFSGETNPLDIGGLVDTSKMPKAEAEKFEKHNAIVKDLSARSKNAATILLGPLQQSTPEGKTVKPAIRRMVEDISGELAAMATVKKPTEGQMMRAERLGHIVGSLLGENAKDVVMQAGQSAGAIGSKLFSPFYGKAVGSQLAKRSKVLDDERMSRSSAAEKLVGLIPPEREKALLNVGVNVRDESVAHYLLDGMQDMFDGDESKVTEKKAVTMFGKEAVEKMRELLGARIEPQIEKPVYSVQREGTEKDSEGNLDDAEPEGGVSDFEARQLTKRAEKSAIDTLIFGKGAQGRGVPLVDALFRNKGRDLPALVHIPEGADRETRKQSGYALEAMITDYGQLPGIKRGKIGKKGSAGSSGYDLAPRTMLSLLDEHAIHEDKRQALLNEYFTKEAGGTGPNAEAAAEAKARLGTVHQARKLLTALNDRIEKNTPATRKRLADEFARSRSGVQDMLQKLGLAGDTKRAAGQAAIDAGSLRSDEIHMGQEDTQRSINAVFRNMFNQMPQDKLVAAAKEMEAYIASQEAEAKDFINSATGGHKKYFGERYVVAATPRDAVLNSDSLTMRPHEFRDMVDHAKTAYSAVKKAALVVAENGRKVTDQLKLRELSGAEGFLQFEDPRNEGKPVVLKAQDIVNWVRKSELGADGDGTSVGFQAFLGYLNQGIAELNRQGFVKGVPYFKYGDEEYAEYGKKLTPEELQAEYEKKFAELAKGKDISDPDVKDRVAKATQKHIDRIERLRGVPAEMTIDGAKAYDIVRAPQSAADDAPMPGKDMSREFALQEQQADHEYGSNHEYDERTGQFVAEDDGLNESNDAESGLNRDVDAKQSLEMFSSATAKRDGHITYNRDNAVGKAAGVADRWWGMYLKNPKQLFAFVNSLTDLYHAAPMARLFSPERMQKFAKDGGVFHDAALALRARAAAMLAGSQFDDGKFVGLTTAGRKASAAALGIDTYNWEGMIAGLKAMARAGQDKQSVLTGLKRKTSTSQPLSSKEAAAHAATDKQALTINEKKAEKLESELNEIDARLTELRKVTDPIDQAKAEGAAARDAAAYVSRTERATVPRSESSKAAGQPMGVPVTAGAITTFKPGEGSVAVKPLTSDQSDEALKAAKAAHEVKLAEARAKYMALVNAVGKAELRKIRQEMNELGLRRKGISKEISKLREKAAVQLHSGTPQFPADKGNRKPVQPKAEPKAEKPITRGIRKTAPAEKIGTATNPIVGDLWAQDGVKVVSTNLGGVHGRGLAKQAADKGLIGRSNVDFDSSPDGDVITLAVKGKAPETAKVPGRAFSEQVVGGNLELLKSELRKLVRHARANPNTKFFLPFVGLGFGEGDPAEIMPVLEKVGAEPNIFLVSKDQATVDKYAGSFVPGVRADATSRKPTQTMTMSFKDGTVWGGIKHVMAKGNEGQSTLELIYEGVRTATTRNTKPDVKVGDRITMDGKDAGQLDVIVTKEPYQLKWFGDERDQANAEKWSKLEGWAPEVFKHYAQKGAWQFQYELAQNLAEKTEKVTYPENSVSSGVKRNQRDFSSVVAQDAMSSRDIMRALGFKTAPPRFADVAEKLLTNPDIDLAKFIKESATALSYVLTHGESFDAIRKALSSDAWFAQRAKIVAGLVKEGMPRGDALVESYRILTERALVGELAARSQGEKSALEKLTQLVKDFIDKFKAMVGSDEFSHLVRKLLNERIEAGLPEVKKSYTKVTFQQAVDGDPVSAKVLAHMSKYSGATITGSIVLAETGSIYRKADNMLHDLDFVIEGTKEDAEAHLRKAFPDAVQVYDFKTYNGKVDSFLVPPAGATIENIVREHGAKGRVVSFEVMKDGKEIGRTWNDKDGEHKSGQAGTFVDFFTGDTGHDTHTGSVIPFTVGGAQFRIKAAAAGGVFNAKLNMHREKDIHDYLLYAPKVGVKLNQRGFKAKNTETQAAPSDADLDAVRGLLGRLLGPQIKVAFGKMLDGNGSWDDVTKIVTIAVAGMPQMVSVAYHEGMHAFFSTGLKDRQDVQDMLKRAVMDERVMEQLRYHLRNSPDALAAMERDHEEAVAYAFELWTEGLIDIAPEAKTFFGKVQRFFRAVLGMISEQDKALEIFQALYDGKMAQPSAAEKAIREAMDRGEGVKRMKLARDRQIQWLRNKALASHRIMRTSGSEAARKLANTLYSNPGSAKDGTKSGMLNRKQMQENKWKGRFAKDVLADLNKAEIAELSRLANDKTDPKTLPEGRVRTALSKLYEMNAEFRLYLMKAGLDIGLRDVVDGEGRFTPMVWALDYLTEHEDEFIKMLVENYMPTLLEARSLMLTKDRDAVEPAAVARMMMQAIVDRTGVDAKLDLQREDGVLAPFFASENHRTFDWIKPEHRAPFLSKDIVGVMTSYYSQGTRAAEYARTFGAKGQVLDGLLVREGDIIGTRPDGSLIYATHDGTIVKELREAAKAKGLKGEDLEAWVIRHHAAVKHSVGAMLGTLGKDIKDNIRSLNSSLLVYQHLRLLPFSLFSAMLDPITMMTSGATLNDALNAYVRGMKSVVKGWKSLATGVPLLLDGDKDETNAILAGVLDSSAFLDDRGEAHASEFVGGKARRVNNKFFRINGLTMWDRSMRISATGAALRFIKTHDKNANPQHSARWMKALGLQQGELLYKPDGDLFLDAHELALSRAQSLAGDSWATHSEDTKLKMISKEMRMAEPYVERVHTAIQRFVQRGVLSPNAAVRPAWASDPHYMALFHLKQYTYSFHETVMKHITEEMAEGNFQPGMAALIGMPVMIAADIMRGLVTGGGSLPGYMAKWGLADWLLHSWGRAGLNGIGQIGIDALHAPASVLGPTADQIVSTAFHPIDKLTTLDMVPVARQMRGSVEALIHD